MTTVKEIVIQSVGEPYSVKIERGQKGGYGYEIGVKSDNRLDLIDDLRHLKEQVEAVIGGSNHEEQKA